MSISKDNTVTQCKSCPWRVDCDPDNDIPNGYCRELHASLKSTIASGEVSLQQITSSEMHVMACHYSKPGEEFPCAGWLDNQLGVGNNLALRLRVSMGQMPRPIVDGEQHERFEDTIPKKPLNKKKARKK